jgi:hypothetical protein
MSRYKKISLYHMITLVSQSGKWRRRVSIEDSVFTSLLPPPECGTLPDELVLPDPLGTLFEREWSSYERMLAHMEWRKAEEKSEVVPPPAFLHDLTSLARILDMPEGWRLGVCVDRRTPQEERMTHYREVGRLEFSSYPTCDLMSSSFPIPLLRQFCRKNTGEECTNCYLQGMGYNLYCILRTRESGAVSKDYFYYIPDWRDLILEDLQFVVDGIPEEERPRDAVAALDILSGHGPRQTEITGPHHLMMGGSLRVVSPGIPELCTILSRNLTPEDVRSSFKLLANYYNEDWDCPIYVSNLRGDMCKLPEYLPRLINVITILHCNEVSRYSDVARDITIPEHKFHSVARDLVKYLGKEAVSNIINVVRKYPSQCITSRRLRLVYGTIESVLEEPTA